MTSKIAFEHIVYEAKIREPIFSSYYHFCLEPIEKDLEVLEIIRKLFVYDEYMGFDIDFRKLKESERNKVKEWLKNEKNN